jgi:hypothetical protein
VQKTTSPATDSSADIGGMVGRTGVGTNGAAVTVEEAVVVGDLSFEGASKSENNSVNGLFTGGLAGIVYGVDNSNRAVLKNSVYRQGIITVNSTAGSAYLGGAVGNVYGYGNIGACSVEAGGFNITTTGNGSQLFAGGFVGDVVGGSTRINTVSGCYADGPVVVNTGSAFEGSVVAGGFVGRSYGSLSYCYATGSVSALGYSTLYAGGFAGLSNASVSYCYAAGNVSAVATGNSNTYVGGLMGSAGGSVTNCYARGNVFIDKSTGTNGIYVGGLLGESNVTTDKCFATGSVIVQQGTSATINAGGLVGYQYITDSNSAQINNSAALGASITATSSGTRNIGRVYGRITIGSAANNHGYNDMKFYQSTTYGAGGIVPTTPTSTDAASKDGKDAHLGIFRSRTFWTGTLGFNSAPVPADAENGVVAHLPWSLTTVEGRGYPILIGADGRIMGGQ